MCSVYLEVFKILYAIANITLNFLTVVAWVDLVYLKEEFRRVKTYKGISMQINAYRGVSSISRTENAFVLLECTMKNRNVYQFGVFASNYCKIKKRSKTCCP